MPYQTLELESAGPVTTLWMNRPTAHNAFDETLIADLTAACRTLDADPTVRVVILAGRGKSFSAGADLNWMQRASAQGVDENLAGARALAHMLRTLAEMKKPTIARLAAVPAPDLTPTGDKPRMPTINTPTGENHFPSKPQPNVL
jgi:methylglutaconyl-CoA hydratase